MLKRWAAGLALAVLFCALPWLSTPAQAADQGELVTDPYYAWGFQWNLDAMDLGPLWALTDDRGRSLTGEGVTVAIVDTGLSSHEDLAPERVLPGHNSVDPDGDASDIHSHGTLVAGILAAQANNDVGMAGVAPGVNILPCMACHLLSGGAVGADDAHTADAILWAADNGADIINISLGSPHPDDALQAAVDYAVERGVIVIAAVGNEGTATLNYPAAYENVIGVGALGEVRDMTAPKYKLGDPEKWAQYSNFNDSVFVVAPGTQMCAPYVTADGQSDYDYPSGTSYATPCVSALAALCRQYDPGITPGEFQALLALTADDRGQAGWDEYYGHGAVDAAAMAAALPPRQVDYQLNGGRWDVPPQTAFRTYQTQDLVLPVPIREGYTFAGWYDDPDCAGQSVTQVALPALLDDLTFYAAWLSDDAALASAALTLDGQTYPFASTGEEYVLYLPFGTDLSGGEVQVETAHPLSRADLAPGPDDAGVWTVRVTAQSGVYEDYTLRVDRSVHAPTLAPGQEGQVTAQACPASLDGLTAAVDWELELNDLFAYPETDLVYTLSGLTVDGEDVEPEDLPALTLAGSLLRFAPSNHHADRVITFQVRADNGRFVSPEVRVTLTVGAVPADQPAEEEPSPTPTPTPTPSPSPRPRPRPRPVQPSAAPSPLPAPEVGQTGPADFKDLSSHWAKAAILFTAAQGLTQGVDESHFSPEAPAHRAMVQAALERLDEEKAQALSPGEQKQDTSALTREELVTLLWRWAGQPQAGALSGFTDIDAVSPQAVQAMAWAVERGLIQGRPGGALAPQAVASRAEAATVLHRLAGQLAQ